MIKLNQEVKDFKESIEILEQRNAKQQSSLEKLEYENTQLRDKLRKFHLKMDQLEQDKYQNSVQIVGLPDHDNEDDMEQVIKITKEKLDIKIKASDIDGISRLGKKREGKTRNLNIKFKDRLTREKVFQQRKKLITDRTSSQNIYINDCLTKHRESVLYTCRKQVKSKNLFAAWSQGGNILIRKEVNGDITQIYDHEDLQNTLQDTSDSECCAYEDMSRTPNESSIETHLGNYSFGYSSDF